MAVLSDSFDAWMLLLYRAEWTVALAILQGTKTTDTWHASYFTRTASYFAVSLRVLLRQTT